MLQEVTSLLTDWGFEVKECLDGQAAWDLIEAGEEFDAMVAQLMLPFKDGWELSQLRIERGRKANVLLTHQWNMITDNSMFEGARISALPVDAEHLETEIRKAILSFGSE